jgi:hypothetical protein
MLVLCPFRRSRMAALLVCLMLLPSLAAAQASTLKAPTIAASAAAAADWASTYHALKYYKVREVNPLLQPFSASPGQMISVGAAMDVGLISTWNLTVGRSHPRMASAGLWAMTAFRSYLAVHNLRNERKAARK